MLNRVGEEAIEGSPEYPHRADDNDRQADKTDGSSDPSDSLPHPDSGHPEIVEPPPREKEPATVVPHSLRPSTLAGVGSLSQHASS